MENSKKRTIRLGLLVTSGLLVFILAIYYLGVKQNLFTNKMTVLSYLHDAAGLVEGNKIRYAGVNVGTVYSVQIVSDTTVLVEMSIDKKIREFIRKDSKVAIGQEGIMGSKILLIHPGLASSERIEENDTLTSIRALTIDDLLRDAKQVIENSRIVSENLTEITHKINQGEGDLAVLLNEKTITPRIEEISRQLLIVSQSANEVIQKINQGEGDLWRLVNDTLITSSAVNLLDDFDQVSLQLTMLLGQAQLFANELNNGNGLAQKLAYDTAMITQVDSTIANLNDGIDEIEKTAQVIRESWLLNLFSGRKKKNN